MKFQLLGASFRVLLTACMLVAFASVGLCEDKASGPDPAKYQATFDKGVKYLSTHQEENGAISSRLGVGPTALAVMALLRSGRSTDDPMVAKGLAFLEEATQETGGIHMPGGRIPNYETCVAMMCLKEANKDGKYDKTLKAAGDFLRGGQIDEKKGKDKSDPTYGGMGYGGRSRPDLSNTAFMIDALRSCGAEADDPAIQKALAFVSRCQNLESEYNTTKYADKVNDGGFFYSLSSGGPGRERDAADEGQPSYGSMSYSGLKSLLYAGLKKDDPRLKAATKWIRKNYTLKSNPGKGDAGLYYYYHTFAKAMNVLGEEPFEDAEGVKHDWRKELFEELAGRQNDNGSWVNENQHWWEGNPDFVTSFALLSLTYCRPAPGTN